MKTYVIAAQHGDELFGLKILGALSYVSLPKLRLRVGNPEAVAKKKRYIDTDLNRSYRLKDFSKEAKLATAIESEIIQFNPDCVVDIHTSRTDMDKVAIIAQYSDKLERFAQALGMESIVVMPPKFTKNSLIGCFPNNCLSIEFGKKYRSDDLASDTAKRIETLEQNTYKKIRKLPRYEVTDLIPKHFGGLKEIINLTYNSKLKGYPFLASESSYETTGGFVAIKVN